MSFIGNLLGIGNNGLNFQADKPALAQPVSADQTAQSAAQAQSGLGQQQAFVDALGAQGGLQNQAQAIQGQQAIAGQLAGQNGIQNQSQALASQQALAGQQAANNGAGNQANVFAQQQALSNQLGQMAQGKGPNPAQDQLNQNTANNIAQQNALMASQRGASQNAGLIARQAAQQGANIQQNAVGQAATLQAQQQIAAANALGQQQAQMGQLANTQVAQQQAQQQNVGNAATTQVGQQLNTQQALVGNAANQVGQQQAGLNSYNQAAGNIYGQQLGAVANQNNAAVSNAGQANSANGAIQAKTADAQAGGVGGILNAAGSIGSKLLGLAHGGKVPEGRSRIAKGRMLPPAMPLANGARVPGKPVTKGDSLKNDKVPAVLSPGEIVLPRSVVNAKDPAKAASDFVRAVLAKQSMKSKTKSKSAE